MKRDNPSPDETLRYLQETTGPAGRHLAPYRKTFTLWGLILLLAGGTSQLLLHLGRSVWIPLVWFILVAAAIAGSVLMARRIKNATGIYPVILRYFVLLWMGHSAVIFTFFLAGWLGGVFDLKFLPALSFPVLALCTLVTAGFMKARSGYVAAGIFLLATIPAILFTQWGLLLQAVLVGGCLLVIGSRNDG
jgi:hypothetical protein